MPPLIPCLPILPLTASTKFVFLSFPCHALAGMAYFAPDGKESTLATKERSASWKSVGCKKRKSHPLLSQATGWVGATEMELWIEEVEGGFYTFFCKPRTFTRLPALSYESRVRLLYLLSPFKYNIFLPYGNGIGFKQGINWFPSVCYVWIMQCILKDIFKSWENWIELKKGMGESGDLKGWISCRELGLKLSLWVVVIYRFFGSLSFILKFKTPLFWEEGKWILEIRWKMENKWKHAPVSPTLKRGGGTACGR